MRYVSDTLEKLAEEKFVFLSGPRQVGKTTVVKEWLKKQNGVYFNWDVPAQRDQILQKTFMQTVSAPAIVLDEIHKYARWKSWVKGLFDSRSNDLKAVVTGSARLDLYQKGGDSLLGRYELLRLHPFSIGELSRKSSEGIPAPPEDWLHLETENKPSRSLWEQLDRRSGFPEPFTRDNSLQHRRWSLRRRDLLVREDLRDLSYVKEISLIEHLVVLLPNHVASPLSLNSLREEIQVAFDTVKTWMNILETLYLCFRISPYSKKINRSLKKEKKLYFWDWSQVPNLGARFENMVASHLLKSIQVWNDIGYGEFELHYWRDLEGREVDFIITESRKPIVAIECKKEDCNLSPHLIRLCEALQIPGIQLVDSKGINSVRKNMRVVSADSFLSALV